jgi:hypothetical protein
MAKQTRPAPPKPQVTPGYFWILLLTCCAAVGGIGLIALEMGEYDWQNEAKVTPAPKVEPLEPPQKNAAPAPNPAPMDPMGER